MSLYTTSDFLKTNYLPGLNNELANAPSSMYGMLKKSPVEIEGATTIVKLRVGDSLGQEVISEGGDYATPGDPDYDEATLELALLNHAIDLTGHEYDLLRSGKAAARDVLLEKLESAQEVMARDIIRQSWGDGRGVIATVASETGSTVTLDPLATAPTGYEQVARDRFIWLDDPLRRRYMVVDPTSGANQLTATGSFTITDIAEATNVLTISKDAGGIADGDYLVHSGTWASGGVYNSLEFDGVQAMVANANTYLNVDRTAAGKDYWQSIVLANSNTNRTLTPALIHELFNKVARRASAGKKPSSGTHCAFASPGVWTAYHEIMNPNIRYTVESSADIGFRSIEMLGVPLYEDLYAPRNTIHLLNKSKIEYVQAKHRDAGLLAFEELGGDIWFKANASSGTGHSDKMYAYLRGFLGMMTKRPREHGVLRDVTEVAGIY